MGIIASVTPSGTVEQLKYVKRLKKRCLVSEVTKHKGVDIVEYDGSEDLNKFPKLKSLTSLKVNKRCVFDLQPEAFWHSSWYFSSTLKPHPLWSGFMQQIFRSSNDVHYNKSDVILLPIIDLQPTNLTCIYSTKLFIQRQADQAGKAYPRALRGYVLVHSALHNLLDEVISSLPQEERWKIESADDVYYNGERNIPDETKESVAKI